jgi:DnaD/phage-associated family protein
MPNRILKESICLSENINELSPLTEVFFYRLIVNCDDYGRLDARPSVLKAKAFPLRLESISIPEIVEMVESLERADLIKLYAVNNHPYLQMTTWESHQQIRAKKSKFPAPDNSCNQMISDDIKCPRNPIQSNTNPNSIQDDNQPHEVSFADVKKFFDNNIHMATPFEIQKLQAWAEDVSTDVILKALERAVEAGVRKFNYIDGILKNLLADGITTIEAWEANERDKEGGVNRGQPPRNSGTTQTKTDKFANLDFSKLE